MSVIQFSTRGRFSAAALDKLFVDNTAPDEDDVAEARRDAHRLGYEASGLLRDHPVKPSNYACYQPAFRPIVGLMEGEGWMLSGSGYFSAVFVKAGMALKVGFKKEDSGASYAAWCRANQGRAGVPTIYNIESFRNCYIVLMERCEALAGECDEFSDLFDPRLATEVAAIQHMINNGQHTSGFDAVGTAEDIRAFFLGIACFDLHRDNIMLDRDGNPVITDPVSFDHAGEDYCSHSGCADKTYCQREYSQAA